MKAKTVDDAALKKVKIEKRHFEAAMKKVQPRTGDLGSYQRLSSKFDHDLEVG